MTGLTRPDQKDTDQAKTMQAPVFRAGACFTTQKLGIIHIPFTVSYASSTETVRRNFARVSVFDTSPTI